MTTHCQCDECLNAPKEWAEYHAKLTAGERNAKMPPFRFLNWRAGNWLARRIYFEREGRQNIVIGGQGEAEVNVKWTPQKTAKHLHYVAGECGYMCGNLRRDGQAARLTICTSAGQFELEWQAGRLEHIWEIHTNGDGKETARQSRWDWSDIDYFPRSEAFPDAS